MIRTSGRLIVGADGKAQAMTFDDAKPNADAHSYKETIVTGRRFKARMAMSSDDQALLARLKPAEQSTLLDKSDEDRAVALGELREVAKPKPAAQAAEPKGATA